MYRSVWWHVALTAAVIVSAAEVRAQGTTLFLPASLEHEIELISTTIALSEAQQGALDWMLVGYVERVGRLDDQIVEVRALAASAAFLPIEHAEYGTAKRELWAKHESIRRELELAEEELFAKLATVLAEVQIPDLTLFRLERTWTNAMKIAPGLRGADIVQLYYEDLERHGFSRRAGHPLVLEYLTTASPMIARLASQFVELAAQAQDLWKRGIEAGAGSDRDELLDRRVKLIGRLRRSGAQLVQVSDAFAARLFRERCNDGTECRLQVEYKALRYPSIYPDRTEITAWLPEILREHGEPASPGQWDAVRALVAEYRPQYSRACIQLENAVDEWLDLRLSGRDVFADEEEEHESRLGELQGDRASLNAKTMRKIVSVLNGE